MTYDLCHGGHMVAEYPLLHTLLLSFSMILGGVNSICCFHLQFAVAE